VALCRTAICPGKEATMHISKRRGSCRAATVELSEKVAAWAERHKSRQLEELPLTLHVEKLPL
jgi:hypothetical protein